MTDDKSWAKIVANYCRAWKGSVTEEMLVATLDRLGLPPLPATLVVGTVAETMQWQGRHYALLSPAEAGKLLQLTAAERLAAEVTKIDAVDEPAVDRVRRLDKERKRVSRQANGCVRGPTKIQMAKDLGVSRPTLDKMISSGRFDPETGTC